MTGATLRGDITCRAVHLPRNMRRVYWSPPQLNRDSRKWRYARLTFLEFDRKRLAQDTLSAISQWGAGKKFVGHDGREYAIVRGIEKPGSERFIDVAVKDNGVDKAVARYAVVLIRISLQ
jgi:hypothetical protein